jgi:serine-type D-Ala-D-Ala carboxypeptidase (penicillin-binding protein 5/6)
VRAKRRQRRERITFVVSFAVIVAAIVTTVYVARNRTTPFQFSLQRADAPAAKPFDHFDFSTYWLATHGQPNLPIHGQAVYLVDVDARQVLWVRDPDTSRAPASLTKMITAMVAVDDAGSLDRSIEVTKAATQVIPSVMGLTAGERLTVRDVLYGLFLDSGNDAAEALATGLVPRDRFVRQMNQKAASIGLTASHFVNPSGLDAPGHGMSAHDLAHTAAYLDAYYPDLAAIAATKDMTIVATDTHKAFYPHNLNRLLWTYPGATGLKTGLTDNAGGCMVATATRNGRHLIAVVLNATLHSTTDAAMLLDYGFSVHPQRAFGPFAAGQVSL